MDLVVAPTPEGVLVPGDDAAASTLTPWNQVPDLVRGLEASQPRWVWPDTTAVYPRLLAAGVRVQRCHDLRLCRAILQLATPGPWPEPAWLTPQEPPAAPTLLDDLTPVPPVDHGAVVAEYARQQEALANASELPGLRLLLAAESAGALIAAEMQADGLPWDRQRHDASLSELLGPRPPAGTRPARLEALAVQVRELLDAPQLNPDSPVALLKALRNAGLDVRSTAKWELTGSDHPVVQPLLQYKQLARLLAANGWSWLDTWVKPGQHGRRGRFHTAYLPGGVVTGRWATKGGGALQIPKVLRAAVRADPQWQLVVADAAQIEPRVLAAMAGDEALATAGRAGDLYTGLVESGVVDTRDHAKIGMLSALYGGTAGEAGAIIPRLRRAYPRAMGLVEEAARTGESGGSVRTWLGRTSPAPGKSWASIQGRAGLPEATAVDEQRARAQARDRGRFTRNFVVQGTAAEWALCWMAEIRRRLRGLDERPRLVFFLHDEVVVHTPAELAPAVAEIVHDAAATAGRLLFGDFPITFPLDVAAVEGYDQAG